MSNIQQTIQRLNIKHTDKVVFCVDISGSTGGC